MINKTNILTIRTPEGVSFPLHLAGPATRCLAWSVDLAVILLLQNSITYSVRFLQIFSPGIAQAFSIILYFVISIFYGIVLEWIWNGKTLGKKVCKLQVVDAEGLRLTFPQVVIRNLMRAIDIVPAFYLIGGISSLKFTINSRPVHIIIIIWIWLGGTQKLFHIIVHLFLVG